MRFVSPETARIDLKPGPNGEERWIEVKKELGKGEEAAYRAAGLGRMARTDTGQNEVEIDWAAMALARVETYLVDWSARDGRGKSIAVTPAAIRNLASDDFDEIDEAIQAHIDRMKREKNDPSGSTSSTSV